MCICFIVLSKIFVIGLVDQYFQEINDFLSSTKIIDMQRKK
jgi:hypothetical protein